MCSTYFVEYETIRVRNIFPIFLIYILRTEFMPNLTVIKIEQKKKQYIFKFIDIRANEHHGQIFDNNENTWKCALMENTIL